MKNCLRAVCAATLMTGSVCGAAPIELPVLPAPGLVDGELVDDCWAKALETEAFTRIDGKPASETTKAYLFRDAENFYIGVRCGFSDYAAEEKLAATGKTAFSGDCVEIFIDPGDSGNYCHIAVSVAGIEHFSGKAAPMKYGVQLHKNDWTFEAKIPFKALKLAKATYKPTWRMNICRGHYAIKEATSWAKLTSGAFHEPSKFKVVSGIPCDLEQLYREQVAAERGDFAVSADHIIYTTNDAAHVTVELKYEKPMKGFSLVAEAKDVAGKTVAKVEHSPVFFTNRLMLPIKGLPLGRYRLEVAFRDAEGKVLKTGGCDFWKAKPTNRTPRPKWEIRDQVLYRDGEIFFPIIDWRLGASEFGMGIDDYLARSNAELEDMARHGCNVTIMGPKNLLDDGYDKMMRAKLIAAWNVKVFKGCVDAGLKFHDFCAMAERHGIAVMGTVPWLKKFTPDYIDGFVTQMTRDREEPNVMMWHTADETDGDIAGNLLRDRLCKEIDPTRYTWLNVINAVAQNKDAADVLATDPYPIPNNPITMVSAHVDRLMESTKGCPGKTQWLWIQNFGGEGSWTRPPTPEEVRAMAYLALNHGVKGLAYFMYTPPERRKDGKRQNPAAWEEAGKVNAEIQARKRVFLLGKKVFSGLVGPLDVAAFEYEDKKYLSCVNTKNEKSGKVTVSVPGWLPVELTLEGYEQLYREM